MILILIFVIILVIFYGVLNYGWVEVDDDFKLAFENSNFTVKFENQLTPLPGDSVIGFSFGEIKRVFSIVNVRFKTQADAESMLDELKNLQKSGKPFKIEWQVNSGGAGGDFFAFDGDNRSMKVLCEKITNVTKEGGGDQTLFKCQMINFVEAKK